MAFDFEDLPENPLIQSLDILLQILVENNNGLPRNELLGKYVLKTMGESERFSTDIDTIIAKLTRDGYIEYMTLTARFEGSMGYKITFDGLLFSYNGGYYGAWWEKNRDWEMARILEKSNKDFAVAGVLHLQPHAWNS